MSNPRFREGSLLSKVTQLGHLAGEEQTQDDFGKLAHREEVRLVLYDPKGNPLVLDLHSIFMACGVLKDGSGRLEAKDGTEGSSRIRDVDSRADTAGHASSLCLSLLICKMGRNWSGQPTLLHSIYHSAAPYSSWDQVQSLLSMAWRLLHTQVLAFLSSLLLRHHLNQSKPFLGPQTLQILFILQVFLYTVSLVTLLNFPGWARMGWHLNPGTEDCPCEHHKSTPRGLLGPASEHHLLCASEQNDMEDFPGRAALVWIRCCLARPSSAREKHLCSASLCILASCSGGQQLFWGRGEQVKFRCVCGEMAKGRGKVKFHSVLTRQT